MFCCLVTRAWWLQDTWQQKIGYDDNFGYEDYLKELDRESQKVCVAFSSTTKLQCLAVLNSYLAYAFLDS